MVQAMEVVNIPDYIETGVELLTRATMQDDVAAAASDVLAAIGEGKKANAAAESFGSIFVGGVAAIEKTGTKAAENAATKAAQGLTGRAPGSSSTFTYQLVDEAGDVVYYGTANDPLRRLGEHARTPPGPFSGMQVVSEAAPHPQALALETSLIQQAHAEGRTIYNAAPTSISPTAPVGQAQMIFPIQTMLNPKRYPPR